MAFTITERQAHTGTAAAGTTQATASFAATGGGFLVVCGGCGSDSSIAFGDATFTGHGGTWATQTGRSFQSADPSFNQSVGTSSDYTSGSAAVTATWGTSSLQRTIYALEVTATSAITLSAAEDFGSAASATAVAGHMTSGVGTLAMQFISSWSGSATSVPFIHFATGTEIEDSNVGSVTSLGVAYCTGVIAHPTIGGLLSTTQNWAVAGLVFYEGSAPTAPVRMNGIGARYSGTGTTSTVIADPNSAAPRDGTNKDVLCRVIKPESATATATSDFTGVGDGTGGTGTTGVDVGQTRLCVEQRDLGSGDTGDVTTAQANTPNSVTGCRFFVEKDSGTWDIVTGVGNDSSHGTGRSASTATPSEDMPLAAGDLVVAIVASDADITTQFTDVDITASGITFGPTVEHHRPGGNGQGNDSGFMLYSTIVESGSGTVQVSFTATGGPSSCGLVRFMRFRQVTAAEGRAIIRRPQSGLYIGRGRNA